MQPLLNDLQPFFGVEGLEESLRRIKRTICAVALGAPHNRIMGSGFLIAPDLVMTNYHVVEYFVTIAADQSVQTVVSGDQIYCFFDYLMQPRPPVPAGATKHACTLVHGAAKWLGYARQSIPYDRTSKSAATESYR